MLSAISWQCIRRARSLPIPIYLCWWCQNGSSLLVWLLDQVFVLSFHSEATSFCLVHLKCTLVRCLRLGRVAFGLISKPGGFFADSRLLDFVEQSSTLASSNKSANDRTYCLLNQVKNIRNGATLYVEAGATKLGVLIPPISRPVCGLSFFFSLVSGSWCAFFLLFSVF